MNFCKQAVEEREMAFFDDPQQLIAHLRHSFVTSDDTGRVRLETDGVGSVKIIMCGLLLFPFIQGMITPISAVFMLSTEIVTLYTGKMGVAYCIDPYIVLQASPTSACRKLKGHMN